MGDFELWPGEIHQLNSNRENLLRWINDDTRLPIACRSRFDARFADTRSDHAAWLVLHYCDPNPGLGLRHDGYAALGSEWVEALRFAIRQQLMLPSSNSTAWARPFLASHNPVEPGLDAMIGAIRQWPLEEFAERWRKLSLAERTLLAAVPRTRWPEALIARSYILRGKEGAPEWQLNQPWISHDLEKLCDRLKSRLSGTTGVASLLRRRAGAAGLRLEIDSLSSREDMAPTVHHTFSEFFAKKPEAAHLFLVGARRGQRNETWVIDPASAEWPKVISHLNTWFLNSDDRALAQASIILIGAPRLLVKEPAVEH